MDNNVEEEVPNPEAATSSTANSTTTQVNVPRSGLPPFAPFDPHSDRPSLSIRWKKWSRRFENLLISLREFDAVVKRGLLLTYVGEATNDIFDTLPDTGTNYDSAMKCLTEYFDPVRNKDMAIYEFRQLKQETGEAINNFYRRLKEKANTCEFTDTDSEIRTQIIHTTSDPRLRRKALREQLNLKALLTYGSTLEKTDMNAKLLEQNRELNQSTNHLSDRYRNQQSHRRSQMTRQNKDNDQARKEKEREQKSQKCRNCGGPFPHKEGKLSCPARGKKCHACGKLGHFAKHCLSKQGQQGQKPRSNRNVNKITEPHPDYLDDTDEEFTYIIYSSTKPPEITVKVANVPVKVIVDTGSSVNLLNQSTFAKIQQDNPDIRLQISRKKVFPYGSNNHLELIGEFKAQITASSSTTTGTFLVTKTNSTCLLSYQTSTALGLLNLKVNSVSLNHPDSDVSAVLNKHKKVFEGMGNLKGKEVKLEIDPNIQPVAQQARRIPHSMKAQVNEKLREMKEQGIIEKAEGATPWLSPLIAIPKKGGDVRLVLDMRIPNQALIRRRVQMPTVDDILNKMEGSSIFTEVDLSQGYLQITLAKESRYITAFPTPDDGPHRFKRLIMGACPSGEYFHEAINELIKEVPNCQNISDNIWLWSKNKKEHLKQLDKLLGTLEENGITLKLPKCSFAVPQINVFGHIVSEKGIQPDKKKVEAVASAPKPKSAAEVRSFLGLVNYCSRYIPDYSSVTYPLRQLTKENTTFHWGKEEDESFQKLKQALSSAPVLAHYNLSAPTRLVVDASPWALGAVLLQQQPDSSEYRPVAYGSRSLTETEMKYGHIEKEALAIVFGCEHFHLYLYGRRFELETDHRPLELIFKPKFTTHGKPPPARIERWLLRLQEYDFNVIYRPGAQNLADPLSRLPTKTPRSNMEACGDRFVHYLAEQNTPVAMSTEEIREEAKHDPEMIQIRECIINNQSYNLPQSYKLVGDELCITEDIVLRGNRIVLPAKLRPRAVALAHEDHAGITRCKQRIRSKLWWPKMDKDVEDHIKTCHPCQITGKPERPEPVRPTKLPDACWTHLAIDVCGPFPTGESVVVLTDYYSRWPEVKILKSVTSAAILQWLDSVFATHGYPEEIKSDNASYFISQEFRSTLKSWGVKLNTVTEYWPQANGQVERFNQVILKHVLTSRAANKDWRSTLPTMLRNYRTTPHQVTKETPAKLLMKRELRTKIPSIVNDKPVDDTELRETDGATKEKYKQYADTRRKSKEKDLKPGDFVLLQQKHKNKYSTTFRPDPLEIIQVNGSQITMKDNSGNTCRRNSSHVKKFLKPEEEEASNDEEDAELPEEKPNLPPPQTVPQQQPIPQPVPQHLETQIPTNENPTTTPSTCMVPLRRSERLNKKLNYTKKKVKN